MTTPNANIMRRHFDTLYAQRGDVATYARGATKLENVQTVPSPRQLEVTQGTATASVVEDWEWLFRVADLKTFFPPKDGDIITRNGTRYQVLPMGGAGNHSVLDADSVLVRIRTKVIGAK